MSINIVIPMAGLGERFAKAGYQKIKPLILVHEKPMIERVIENLYVPNANWTFVLNKLESSAELQNIIKDWKIVRSWWTSVDQYDAGYDRPTWDRNYG